MERVLHSHLATISGIIEQANVWEELMGSFFITFHRIQNESIYYAYRKWEFNYG